MPTNDGVERERTLRDAVVRGDVLAWQALYDHAFAAVFDYVRWRCAGLHDLAEDITQETWLVAVRRVGDFDPERGAFAHWLCGIAAQLLRNHFRAKKPATNRALPERTATDPADLEMREQAERVARVLAELPERYEAVLRAKYFEQRRVEEIADQWHETPKTVESLLTRARRAFESAYGLPHDVEDAIREMHP